MATLNDPLQAARSLRETIQEHRKETEEARHLAPPIVEGLIQTGLCRLVVPASLGGYEADPVTLPVVLVTQLVKVDSMGNVIDQEAIPELLATPTYDVTEEGTFLAGTNTMVNSNSEVPPAVLVPEPHALLLLFSGIVGLFGLGRLRTRKHGGAA